MEKGGWEGTTRKKDEKEGKKGRTRREDKKGGHDGRMEREAGKGGPKGGGRKGGRKGRKRGREGRKEREEGMIKSLPPNYNYFIAKFFIAPILIINFAKIDQNPSDTLFAPRTLKFLPTFLSRRPRDKYVIYIFWQFDGSVPWLLV